MLIVTATLLAPATGAADEAGASRVVARVGDGTITEAEFAAALEEARRARFFHGKPPEGQASDFHDEVVEQLVTRELLLQEIGRRGIEADERAVRSALERHERRYAADPRWRAQRESLLGALEARLAERDALRQLEEAVRRTPAPTEEQLLGYFRDNADKFVEPARQRVSLILLAVEPSAPPQAWAAADAEAAELVRRLRDGADFEALARQRSDDVSARDGGDMGYLHSGMLSRQAETAIAALAPGEITEPVRVLEGVAVFALVERHPPRPLDLERVRDRVAELWRRARGEERWQRFLATLRASTPIEIRAELSRP